MFQFINKDTKKVYTLNEIDEICAKFWGVEMHPKYYAQPKDFGVNWFEALGRAIEDSQFFKHLSFKINNKVCFDMDTISSMILFHFTKFEKSTKDKMAQIKFAEPYIDLCYHLDSLNIVGVGLGWLSLVPRTTKNHSDMADLGAGDILCFRTQDRKPVSGI